MRAPELSFKGKVQAYIQVGRDGVPPYWKKKKRTEREKNWRMKRKETVRWEVKKPRVGRVKLLHRKKIMFCNITDVMISWRLVIIVHCAWSISQGTTFKFSCSHDWQRSYQKSFKMNKCVTGGAKPPPKKEKENERIVGPPRGLGVISLPYLPPSAPIQRSVAAMVSYRSIFIIVYYKLFWNYHTFSNPSQNTKI